MALTPSEAYAIASQWGSYMHATDAGACFYAFHLNDARPQSEAHRRNCRAYIVDTCLPAVMAEHDHDGDEMEARRDWRDLILLYQFFGTAPLHVQVGGHH